MTGSEILTVAQMKDADRLAVEAGVPSLTLMENAGRAVADCVAEFYPAARVIVLCGPGNNGGDGFVAARLLKERGFDVRLGLFGTRDALKGDAAAMAMRWNGGIKTLSEALADRDSNSVVLDAMFGAGLTRRLEGEALAAVRTVTAKCLPVVAVDVPSGTHGDTGHVMGDAPGAQNLGLTADHTVTFFRKKPAHVLYPGRQNCGVVHLVSIGIPESVLETIKPKIFENGPSLWRQDFVWPHPLAHKYTRGHTLVVSGPPQATGAARLAARGALRVGAGLVSVASPLDAVAVNAAHLTAVMVKPFADDAAFRALLSDKRMMSVVVGPGNGAGADTQRRIRAALDSDASVVLDADALTAIAGEVPAYLTGAHPRVVLTPHEGEFERLFPGLLARSESRILAALTAAHISHGTIVLKGPDTIIAALNGCVAVNTNAPPFLATAGSGDVLAGMIAGLLLQMECWKAACAGVWLHGEAANHFGLGLIAEDIPDMLPMVLKELQARPE